MARRRPRARGVRRRAPARRARPRGPRRGVLHAAAGALYIVNPYVTVDANRTSIALLSYAALPWLLLCVHRGLRAPRGWWWPAAFALVLTSTGGGVNAATTAWVLLGPALLIVYERVWGGVAGGALRAVAAADGRGERGRPGVVGDPRARAGEGRAELPALQRAARDDLVDDVAVRVAAADGLLDELRRASGTAACCGRSRPRATRCCSSRRSCWRACSSPRSRSRRSAWTRRWRYAPFFLLLTLVGLVVMAAGFPDGTPLRRGVTFAYYRVETIQFLRTTYKAGALPALGIACLGGAALAALWTRVGAGVRARPAAWRAAAVAGAAGLAALAAWPLVSGRAPSASSPSRVPSYWRALARDLDRRGDDTRALVEPGQRFAYYRWGGTIDAILPALTKHPVATRWIVPFADLRSADLQWTVDDLIGQERLRPGQLAPLLDLMGVGDLVVAADGDRSRAARRRRATWRACSRSGPAGGGLRPAVRAAPDAGTIAPAPRVPAVRGSPVRTGGLVRLLPRSPLTVVDGGAGGLAGLAAYGALDADRPIAYAPDLGPAAALRRRGARRGELRDRRPGPPPRVRVLAPARRPRRGPRRRPGPGVDGALLDPFGANQAAETVALVRGVRAVTRRRLAADDAVPGAPAVAALDGDPATAWLADRALVPSRHALDRRVHGPPRRAVRRPACRTPTAAASCTRSRSAAAGSPSTAAGTGCRCGCAHVARSPCACRTSAARGRVRRARAASASCASRACA